jgi:DNA-directed RNA polymerase subunit RPC12/RpoP
MALLPTEIIIPLIIVAIVILVPVIVALLNRGKKLKCPDCGHVFKAPFMDEKSFGIGWTFPYVGRIKCSRCGASHSRKTFSKVQQ